MYLHDVHYVEIAKFFLKRVNSIFFTDSVYLFILYIAVCGLGRRRRRQLFGLIMIIRTRKVVK